MTPTKRPKPLFQPHQRNLVLRQSVERIWRGSRKGVHCQRPCARENRTWRKPCQKSGKAITIDGAFSEAYGDYGYTLLIEPAGTFLALHHHFEKVEKAVRDGVDIIPQVTVIREETDIPMRGDTEEALVMADTCELLERLVMAYRANQIAETFTVKP